MKQMPQQMHLHDRQIDGQERIQDRDRSVAVGARVDDHGLGRVAGGLDPADQLALAVGLAALNRRDFCSSYSNIIIWRNTFAHEGKLNTTATYAEVIQAYQDGKEVIHSLADAMTR